MFTVTPVAGDDPRIRPVLDAHAAFCSVTSPDESCHFLPPDTFVADDLLVWAVFEAGTALGVAALRVSAEEAEVKSMHTAVSARGQGVADALLDAILAEARALRLPVVRLETGTADEFSAARRLYTRHGFSERGPFGNYALDPLSAFYELRLTEEVSP